MLFCKVMSARVSVTLLQPPLITPTSSGPEVSSLSRFLRIAALTPPLHWRSHKLIHDNMPPIEQTPHPANSYIVFRKGGNIIAVLWHLHEHTSASIYTHCTFLYIALAIFCYSMYFTARCPVLYMNCMGRSSMTLPRNYLQQSLFTAVTEPNSVFISAWLSL